MAKSTSKKTVKSNAKTNAAYSDKSVQATQQPAGDNDSKYQPTNDAELDVITIDPSDGLSRLFTDCIKDIYWAENHLVKALPKMSKAASSTDLQQAILNHLEQTKTHVQRLEQVFEILGKSPQAKKCDAMEGLTKEGEGVIETTDMGSAARDLGIIMASQKVEHYEISSYTGLVKLAGNLRYNDIAELLAQTLTEEEEADQLLAGIADKLGSFNDADQPPTDEREEDEMAEQ